MEYDVIRNYKARIDRAADVLTKTRELALIMRTGNNIHAFMEIAVDVFNPEELRIYAIQKGVIPLIKKLCCTIFESEHGAPRDCKNIFFTAVSKMKLRSTLPCPDTMLDSFLQMAEDAANGEELRICAIHAYDSFRGVYRQVVPDFEEPSCYKARMRHIHDCESRFPKIQAQVALVGLRP